MTDQHDRNCDGAWPGGRCNCYENRCGACQFREYEVAHVGGASVTHCRAQFPHVEPPADCALEELNLWLVENALPEGARDWLLAWANRRAANVIEFLAEPMTEIAAMAPPEEGDTWRSKFHSAQFVARCALRTCALNNEETQQ